MDPPLKNTIDYPRDGWVAIKFKEANNPGKLHELSKFCWMPFMSIMNQILHSGFETGY